MLLTYWTPLFWFCLFLFIFNLILRFFLPLDFEVFCYYLTRPKLQRALSIMKWFLCIYCLVSCGYRIYSNFFSLIWLHSPCTMLPLDPSSSGVSSGRTEQSHFWKNWTCCFTPTQDESHSVSPPEPTKIPKWVLDVDLPCYSRISFHSFHPRRLKKRFKGEVRYYYYYSRVLSKQ